MGKERNNGQIKITMKENILKVRNKEKESMCGVTEVAMMESGSIIKSMASVSTDGLMVEAIKVVL